jgi:hypothetical protein
MRLYFLSEVSQLISTLLDHFTCPFGSGSGSDPDPIGRVGVRFGPQKTAAVRTRPPGPAARTGRPDWPPGLAARTGRTGRPDRAVCASGKVKHKQCGEIIDGLLCLGKPN